MRLITTSMDFRSQGKGSSWLISVHTCLVRVAKLMPRWDGPFVVIKAHPDSSSYTLDLTGSMQANNFSWAICFVVKARASVITGGLTTSQQM